MWSVETGDKQSPLLALVSGPKRHAEFLIDADGSVNVVDFTEARLGATYADPPALRGRGETGNARSWSLAVVEREIAYSLARGVDSENAIRAEARWEAGSTAFPTLRRLMVKTPEMARTLSGRVVARPGTRYAQAIVDILRRGVDPVPVALDPGGYLVDWQHLVWVDRSTGLRFGLAPIMGTPVPSCSNRWTGGPSNRQRNRGRKASKRSPLVRCS